MNKLVPRSLFNIYITLSQEAEMNKTKLGKGGGGYPKGKLNGGTERK